MDALPVHEPMPPSTALLPPAATALDGGDIAMIDAVVRDITEITRRHSLAAAVEIGRYLLDRLFGGDYGAFCERNPYKASSFRALCRRDDLPVSMAFLRMAIHVARQVEEFPEEVARQLSVAHHRALLPLKDADRRVLLGRRAVVAAWSASRLVREVRRELPPSRAGRKAHLPVARHVRRLAAVAEQLARVVPSHLDHPTDREAGEQALVRLTEAITEITAARDRLGAALRG